MPKLSRRSELRKRALVSPGRYDPTGTATLRKKFVNAVVAGYRRLKAVVYQHVKGGLTVNETWVADSNPRKLERFRAWLRQQTGSTLAGDALITEYIGKGHRRGAEKALKVSASAATLASRRSPDFGEGFAAAQRLASQTASVSSVKLLASRTFVEMEEVNSRMAARMSRALATGLMSGASSEEIASEIADVTTLSANEAARVARTELVRAHAEGQLDGFTAMRVQNVKVLAEYATAGDTKVCAKCKGMDGAVVAIEDARGIIPLHPECRCAWVIAAATELPTVNAFTLNNCGTGAGGFQEGNTCASKAKFVGQRVGKAEHLHSEYVEKRVARYVKGTVVKRVKGKQQATDVERGLNGFEVKALLKGDKDGITVHEDALLRKVKWEAAETGRVFHTVVVDERDVYEDGAHAHKYSGHKLYYKRGSGRYTLGNMHKVSTWGELHALSDLPYEELPEKAKGQLPHDRVKDLEERAAKAHAARLKKDRARKQRLRDERINRANSP